jgi:hypothetical protein
VEFRRITDFEDVRRILTSRETYYAMGDDFIAPHEEFQVNQHPDIWYVGAHNETGVFGLFSLCPENRVCWQVHVVMLPWATKQEKWNAARELPGWLAKNTECKRLTAAVPSTNWPALIYGTHGIGLQYVGKQPRSFMKGGHLQDLILLGLSIGE